MTPFQQFAPLLLKRGFRKAWTSRVGGGRVDGWKKEVGPRLLQVQLWADGGHRISHALNGRGSTLPTYFVDMASLDAAIEHETTRTDHKPRV